ncbi:acetyl-CoA carboxylase, carboxyltransferase subunit beta [Candidatus Atelocyanobacterium thalassae]|uniref:Acetyl-coenzyme A carboxylase carboxyl transferase subunit beta n=2 Tax=Candidatus Atelocyanobacterium thalassae TaxID=713887 RepID=A0A086CIA3_9CHRO|nr:acetyl-CoA carboxylase, carboxyltransferase subunit beta [Candidatus Atelocyanobacterium thalassa]KFF41917.1 MAG: acetyl-CoA carboxylase carboxyltransferase subunit alpha [Candidatus Atelocyanobacterium thalassa isolate SIO64986]BDA40256.1 acetyl-coenzyme A carboxylase carboxyl transferase subunit beta [cyanobacterium endosymbiont of Braarudosphaera bigelowii]
MSIFDWFAKQEKSEPPIQQKKHKEREIADGLWTKCEACGTLTYAKDLKTNQLVCKECGYHFRMESSERIIQLIDNNTWKPLSEMLSPIDPLKFCDRKLYSDRIKDTQKKTGLIDAVQTGTGLIDGLPVALGVMDFHFMGGSMGSVVGEKLCRLIENATKRRFPVVIFCASGGARMQEGMLSLMQMAKISGALERHRNAKLLYISVLTHPTTGGVTASFAMLGDIILAEPNATIGFAGKRVIEQTLREKLPDGFQTSEYLLKHGFVDSIISRTQQKKILSQLISIHQPFSPVLPLFNTNSDNYLNNDF